uniref:Major facilitator superfamily (MFS) profile domain-containing protein n=1 Tax=Lotharella oceanica TaxID=641309 RepID=A0A7S2TKR2_9EUKA|mmetsp:Transcript_1878/g.3549  ORF Transcript_1878/g.3549 Transcript_1878/m.3549 type:complete len:401 (+) Transcript_1878:3-1205(+)
MMMMTMMMTMTTMIQSIVADLAPSERRGKLFGLIGSVEAVGGLVGAFIATAIAEETIASIRGWRLCLGVVGFISVCFAFLLGTLMTEPAREGQRQARGQHNFKQHPQLLQQQQAAAAAAHGNKKGFDWETMRLPTFWLLVLQGVFGCIPWQAFGMYSTLWLELIGYTPLQVAFIGSAGRLAHTFSGIFAGVLGDWSHSRLPYHGRLLCAEASVLFGLIWMTIMLLLLPKDNANHIYLFAAIKVAFCLTATWTPNSTNRPMIADIVPTWARSSIFSIFVMAERVPSSFAGYFVSFLAESQFGYYKPDHVKGLSDAGRRANVVALSTALALMTSIPWILCMFTYSSMHLTYSRDVKRTAQRVAQYERGRYKKIVDVEAEDDDDDDDIAAGKCLLAKAEKVLE